MDDLIIFADKFKKWRGDKRHYRYPKHFWDEIRLLAKTYPLQSISHSLSISLQYLKQKLKIDAESVTFLPLNVISQPAPVTIEFLNRYSCKIIIRLQADHAEMAQLIESLSGNE